MKNRLVLSVGAYIARKCSSVFTRQFLVKFHRLLRNLPAQARVIHVMARRPYSDLVKKHPFILFKHLELTHLALGISPSQRAQCISSHYRLLKQKFPRKILHQTISGSVPLFTADRHGSTISIEMHTCNPFYLEGELSLNFLLDGQAIFNLSCTVVPGRIFSSRAEEVILISRLQGVKGLQPQVQLAAQKFHDVSPAAMLLAAVEGIALALDIDQMVAVGARNHPSSPKMTVMGIEDSLRRTYDAFFLSVGALQQDTGNYSLPVPLPEKPLELVKRNNRLRTRKRRAFKRHIADCAYAVVAGRCETESAAPIFASDFFATSEISPQTNVHMRPSSAEEPSIPAFPNL